MGGEEFAPSLFMDQSINRHNSLTITGVKSNIDGESISGLSGGEFSVFAMNRGRQRLIDILHTWQKAKDKKVERALKDEEKDKLV